jgi:hypothetical protein
MKSYKGHRYREKMKEAEAEAERLVLEKWEEFSKKADVSILFALRETFGFGKERLERFYENWLKTHIQMISRYQTDGDDSHYWVMEARLREIGVDIDELQKKADEIGDSYNG